MTYPTFTYEEMAHKECPRTIVAFDSTNGVPILFPQSGLCSRNACPLFCTEAQSYDTISKPSGAPDDWKPEGEGWERSPYNKIWWRRPKPRKHYCGLIRTYIDVEVS